MRAQVVHFRVAREVGKRGEDGNPIKNCLTELVVTAQSCWGRYTEMKLGSRLGWSYLSINSYPRGCWLLWGHQLLSHTSRPKHTGWASPFHLEKDGKAELSPESMWEGRWSALKAPTTPQLEAKEGLGRKTRANNRSAPFLIYNQVLTGVNYLWGPVSASGDSHDI